MKLVISIRMTQDKKEYVRKFDEELEARHGRKLSVLLAGVCVFLRLFV